eukprot:CAMPEP_0119077066 /NCGR_PEP_ID=MMETSP1178-20130426/92173_1 /TAXON_ID=33656 /ORGANISM="unid sp, Strain CCMP2000" /LENGTH=129 /DNA_ID=CAMNT_0007059401 /DNA_START=118 /DNA_END=507 /DNA_ORIENTATION=+
MDMEDDSAHRTKKRRPSMGWMCFRCAKAHEAHSRFVVVTLAVHGSQQQQLAMCLSCKWADPLLWIQGQQKPMEPGLAEAMAQVREHSFARMGGELTEHDDAELEQRALQELQRRRLNPRLCNSGMVRGF